MTDAIVADPIPSAVDPAPAADPAPVVADPAPAPAADPVDAPFYNSMPEDWRNQAITGAGLEGDDATAALNMLGTVKDFPSLIKNYTNAQKKIAQGEVASGLPENPTDEQLSKWREANGVPLEADKYELDLGEGVVLTPQDQAVLDGLMPVAHSKNISTEAFQELSKSFFESRAAEASQRQQQDNLDAQATTRALQAEWGADMEVNKNIIAGALAQLPEEVRSQVANARLPDGKGLLNSPEALNWLVDMARKANPTAALVPSGSGNIATMNGRIEQIDKMMREDPQAYYKDEAIQAEYRQLLEAQEQVQKQNA